MKYAIVGAGPAGLILFLKLKSLGISADNITLIDKRHGRYTRPAYIDKTIIEDILPFSGISVETLPIENSMKFVERALYTEAQTQGAQFLAHSFKYLEARTPRTPKGIRLSNGEFLPADIVFDCTGSSRVVISDINEQHMAKGNLPHFEKKTVTDVHCKHHFVAYGRIPQEHWDKYCTLAEELTFKNTSLPATFEALRTLSALGWKHANFPFCQLIPLPHKRKVIIYMECPESLEKSDYHKWVNTLLRILLNEPKIHFERMSLHSKLKLEVSGKPLKKPRFMPFEVEPTIISPHSFSKEPKMPTVIPIGDAQMTPEYRLGYGLNSAKLQIEALLASTTRDGQTLSIDLTFFAEQMGAIIRHYRPVIKTFYSERNTTLAHCDVLHKALLKSKPKPLFRHAKKPHYRDDLALFSYHLQKNILNCYKAGTLQDKPILDDAKRQDLIRLIGQYVRFVGINFFHASVVDTQQMLHKFASDLYKKGRHELDTLRDPGIAIHYFNISNLIFSTICAKRPIAVEQFHAELAYLACFLELNKHKTDLSNYIKLIHIAISRYNIYGPIAYKQAMLERLYFLKASALWHEIKALVSLSPSLLNTQRLQEKAKAYHNFANTPEGKGAKAIYQSQRFKNVDISTAKPHEMVLATHAPRFFRPEEAPPDSRASEPRPTAKTSPSTRVR